MRQEFLGRDARKLQREGLLDDGIDAELEQHARLGRGRHDQARGIFRTEKRARVREKREHDGEAAAAPRGVHGRLDDGAVAEVHAVKHADRQVQRPPRQGGGLFERGISGIHVVARWCGQIPNPKVQTPKKD